MTVVRGAPWFKPIVERVIGPLPEGVIFTYGHKTYASTGLTGDLLAHEREHTRQQGRFPSLWWIRYLVDRRFRLREELAAYRVQMRYLRTYGRIPAHKIDQLARALSGAMYGRLIEYGDAARAMST